MEGLLCAMVLDSTNGRQKQHHTQAGLRVCCELALKSAGTRAGRCWQVRETARAKDALLRVVVERLCMVRKRQLAARVKALQASR
jgi:hypothetical protein